MSKLQTVLSLLSLGFLTLIASCSTYDDPRPSPRPLETPGQSAPPRVSETQTVTVPWYKRGDRGEVVVLEPGVLLPEERQGTAYVRRPTPTLTAYRNQLESLHAARQRLMDDNARLRLSVDISTPAPPRLGSLQRRLERLKVQQYQVNSASQTVAAEHGEILELLAARPDLMPLAAVTAHGHGAHMP
jgi:hypothetical protein